MVDLRRSLATVALLSVPAFAAESPSADIEGAKDNSIISRFRGAVIIGYQQQDYAALTLPLDHMMPDSPAISPKARPLRVG